MRRVKWREVPAPDVPVGSTVGHLSRTGVKNLSWCECELMAIRKHTDTQCAYDLGCGRTVVFGLTDRVRHVPV